VALYTFNVAASGSVSFTSLGFAGGGVDPYFSLFSGSGNAAGFLGSNYVQAFSTGAILPSVSSSPPATTPLRSGASPTCPSRKTTASAAW
jgi:hypothetical protein